jgi:glyoxylate/hydroxypyruvate reductase A
MTLPIPFLARADYPQTKNWIAALQKAMPDEKIVAFDELDEHVREQCVVAIVANPDPEDLRRLPRLQWVHSVWAGVERLMEDLGETDLKIVRLVDPQLAETMAEAVLAWTLYLHRNMPAYADRQRRQEWQPIEYTRPQQRRIGLLGLGALGKAAAQRLSAANLQVNGWSRHRKSLQHVTCFAGADELRTMLSRTDILVCLLPLTADTTGLLDTETLACLPQGAELINFARGPIVDDAALRAALDGGRINHAVLDVFAIEPLPPDAWQWHHPRVTVLPHCSAPTDRETASAIVAGNILAWRMNGAIPESVNPLHGY